MDYEVLFVSPAFCIPCFYIFIICAVIMNSYNKKVTKIIIMIIIVK